VLLCMHFNLLWLGITLGVLIALFSVLAIRGRRLTGWIAAMFAWQRRHKTAPPAPSEPAVGATVMPGDHVAVRWLGDHLISVVELVPRSFTPTVIVNGEAFTDDNLDTRLVEQLLTAHAERPGIQWIPGLPIYVNASRARLSPTRRLTRDEESCFSPLGEPSRS